MVLHEWVATICTVKTRLSGVPNSASFHRASSASAVLAIVILSVSQSVCLSVRPSHACFVTKPYNVLRIFWYHTNGQSLWYSDTNSGWWAMPIPSEIWAQSHPPLRKMLRQISAYDISTETDSEKLQLRRLGSRARAFQRAIAGVRTLSLCPPKGGSKSDFFVFWIKVNFNRIKYNISLYENFQRQSCITIPPSNGWGNG